MAQIATKTVTTASIMKSHLLQFGSTKSALVCSIEGMGV